MELDCLFCKIVHRQLATSLIDEDDQVIVFNDIHPQAPIHLLIVPKIHIASLLELPKKSYLMTHLSQCAIQQAQKNGIDSKGFRLVINCGPEGGQTISHLHVHLMGGRPMLWPPG